jgi:hypothetical protein
MRLTDPNVFFDFAWERQRMHRHNLTRRRLEAGKREFPHVVRSSLQRRRGGGDAIASLYHFPGMP